MKKESLIVLSKQEKSIRQLIRNEVKKKQATLFEEGINWKIAKVLKNSFILDFCGNDFEFEKPCLHGNHQIENVSTALASILAVLVLPVPFGPQNKYACAILSSLTAFLRVLVICNMTAREILIKGGSRPACSKNIVFGDSQKIHEFPMDLNRSDFLKNSPRENSFHFCCT